MELQDYKEWENIRANGGTKYHLTGNSKKTTNLVRLHGNNERRSSTEGNYRLDFLWETKEGKIESTMDRRHTKDNVRKELILIEFNK